MNFRLLKGRNPVNEEEKVSLIVKIVGSGLFTGYIPFASGTFGSVVGLLIFLIPGFSSYWVLSLAIVAGFFIGIVFSQLMVKRYGDDPAEVVIDEIVGLWFTFLVGYIMVEFIKFKSFDPTLNFYTKLTFGIVSFIFFRIFDIIKLWPARYFDDKKTGFGIMMDDIVSAFYAGILSSVVSHFIWHKFIKLMV
ncbi:MAG: phosphatidylglycerophosphatase A [Ignavibacteriae bacterium]|nr:MAG: phosphatidylglycerophosphatase A [Ignavibacteriota bacterium]